MRFRCQFGKKFKFLFYKDKIWLLFFLLFYFIKSDQLWVCQVVEIFMFFFPFFCFVVFFYNRETFHGKSLRACLVPIFKNRFLFLKTKNTKNLFGEGDVFLFFVFSAFSKTTFFITIKRCFHCFFLLFKEQIVFCFFLCFLSCFLCFHKGKLHPTTTPPPAIPFFFFKLLKLIYLYMVTKSSFV